MILELTLRDWTKILILEKVKKKKNKDRKKKIEITQIRNKIE
jgi:hypothetical protein